MSTAAPKSRIRRWEYRAVNFGAGMTGEFLERTQVDARLAAQRLVARAQGVKVEPLVPFGSFAVDRHARPH
jgi:hypothetical protein